MAAGRKNDLQPRPPRRFKLLNHGRLMGRRCFLENGMLPIKETFGFCLWRVSANLSLSCGHRFRSSSRRSRLMVVGLFTHLTNLGGMKYMCGLTQGRAANGRFQPKAEKSPFGLQTVRSCFTVTVKNGWSQAFKQSLNSTRRRRA